MRARVALLAGAALAACSPATESNVLDNGLAQSQAGDVAPGAAMPPEPPPLENQHPVNVEAAAPEGAAARYVGRWAANEGLCKDGAWRFEERHLATAGEVSCDFDRVTQVSGGYDIHAQCLAEGNRTTEVIKVRFAESARAMLVESPTFREVGLIPCPD
ncbi:MAG: hypothetical protein J7500_11160 [Sphingomonas sp.]|uniref:hypothetical protein n=1 Tax=Sphingomonas sp. TaxID=28214 RepID=UPI001B11AC46|nr:hypothetical protein [Sphingomonas sp.]MBO9623258.1 hypothetical protein [Sphingomonas sp.]